MLDPHVGGRGCHLVRGCRRDNGHCMAPGDVRVHKSARFRVDEARNLLEVELLRHLRVNAFFYTSHKLRVNGHQTREAEAAEAKARHGAHHIDQLSRRYVAATNLFPDKGCGGIASNNSAVEIKYRGNLRAAGRRLDVFQKCLEGAHDGSLSCPMSIPQILGLGVALGDITTSRSGLDIKKPPGQRPDGIQGVKLFLFCPGIFPARCRNTSPGPKHL